MRKCAAIICAVLMTASVCACGKKAPATTKKTSIPMITTTTTAPIPTVTFPEEPDKEPLNLTFATAFSDGVALVRYVDGEGAEHAAAINPEGDVLFELPTDMPFDGPGYKDGIRVVNDVIYDKTGAVIADPETTGYHTLMTGSCGGYVVAQMTEQVQVPTSIIRPTESTSTTTTGTEAESATASTAATSTTATSTTATSTTGTDATGTVDSTDVTLPTIPTEPPMITMSIVSVGVLNNKGEWVQPLSVDHPIAVAMANNAASTVKLEYITDDVLRVGVEETGVSQYYHFSDNSMTDYYGQYASFGTNGTEAAGVYRMKADGTKELVVEGVFGDYFFSDLFIGREVIPATVFGDPETMGTYKIYDYSGKVLADLSTYTFGGAVGQSHLHYAGEHFVLPVTDELGSRLLAVIDKAGNPVYETPLALGLRDTMFAPDDSGFVVESYTLDGAATYRHYDYEGNVTDYAEISSFAGFSEGMAAVTVHGDDQHYYYINHKGEIVLH